MKTEPNPAPISFEPNHRSYKDVDEVLREAVALVNEWEREQEETFLEQLRKEAINKQRNFFNQIL